MNQIVLLMKMEKDIKILKVVRLKRSVLTDGWQYNLGKIKSWPRKGVLIPHNQVLKC